MLGWCQPSVWLRDELAEPVTHYPVKKLSEWKAVALTEAQRHGEIPRRAMKSGWHMSEWISLCLIGFVRTRSVNSCMVDRVAHPEGFAEGRGRWSFATLFEDSGYATLSVTRLSKWKALGLTKAPRHREIPRRVVKSRWPMSEWFSLCLRGFVRAQSVNSRFACHSPALAVPVAHRV